MRVGKEHVGAHDLRRPGLELIPWFLFLSALILLPAHRAEGTALPIALQRIANTDEQAPGMPAGENLIGVESPILSANGGILALRCVVPPSLTSSGNRIGICG